MISASTQAKTDEVHELLKNAHNINVNLNLIAEWNMNRFVKATHSNGTYPDDPMFPIASITEGRRPQKAGIHKARVVASGASTESIEGKAVPPFTNAITPVRYYASSVDDPYKYWSSPIDADVASGTAGVYNFATAQQPTVIYEQLFQTNKIVIGLENSTSSPVDFTVQVTTNGTSWTTIATKPAINADGQIVLYLQDSLSWSAVVNRDAITQIKGIRLNVTSMNKNNAFLNVIEMSPRIENDLTPFVTNWNATFEMSDVNFITPLGRSSSNIGSVTLSNHDLRFSNDNPASLYFDIIDKNTKFMLDAGVQLAGGSYEQFRQFTMYTDSWAPDDDMQVSVSLKDSSTYSQQEIVPATYFENHTVAAIIWRLMDIMGYTNYNYTPNEDDSQVIPYFWTTGEDTLWDIIANLAEMTQTAVFYDEYDVLQIRTKNNAMNPTQDVDWALSATSTTGQLANIINATQTRTFDANSIDIKYATTAFSDFNNGFPKMEVVWEPEETIVLRAAPIAKAILANSEYITINPAKAATWQYTGMVNVEGEVIRYEGKHYYYYDKAGLLKDTLLKSGDDKKRFDTELSDELLAWKNHFSGNLKITKRGEFGTEIKDHTVYEYIPLYTGPRYAASLVRYENITARTSYGSYFDNNNGTLMLAAWPSATWWDIFLVENQWTEDKLPAQNARWGTRVKFRKDGYPESMGEAGLHFMGGYNGTGLYASIHPSVSAEAGGWPEVWLVLKHRDGQSQVLGQVASNIEKDVWYDLEVDTRWHPDNQWHIVVYLNGQPMMTYWLPSFYWDNDGRTGAFIRSNCIADFEYLYAFEGDAADPEINVDESGQILDLIYGGFRSNYVMERYHLGKFYMGDVEYQKWVNRKNYFDEFTPIAHEMREFDVKFKEQEPAGHSRVYLTNESQVACLEYNSGPFSAKFILSNASRADAVVNGEDAYTFGPDNSVDQKLFVYGRVIAQEEPQSVIASNDDSLRRRGKTEVTIESKWIQSKDMAQATADWIVSMFAGGSDEIEVEIFGHPLIQLGDLVSLNHPAMAATSGTHKYFVTVANKDWENGYRTNLTLRRANV